MDAERWRRVDQVVQAALDAEPGERAEILGAACGGDEELHREAASLLAADERAGDFLADSPVLGSSSAGPASDRAAANSSEPAAGDRLGPFRLVRPLGRGGMGVVFLAERADDDFDQRVAVKVVRWDLGSATVDSRFRAERQILASLEHPGIARLLDGGTSATGQPWLAMEHVDGEAIDRFCDRRRLDVGARLALFLEVLAAVDHAHRNLVVHRDLKPSNILVKDDGTVKLLDFGIAKLLAPDTPSEALTTAGGERPVTFAYASPEQLTGRPVTTGSDVYALGVILFQLLTGELPRRWSGHLPGDLRALLTEPRPPSAALEELEPAAAEERAGLRGTSTAQLGRRLRGDLDTIVTTALRADPERRYRSVAELEEDLRRHLDGRPVRARPPSWTYRAGKFLRRNWAAVAATAAFVLLLAAFAVFMALQADELARERDRAEEARAAARDEQEKASEVADLMAGLFDEMEPARALGREVTVRELLDRRIGELAVELRDRPELLGILWTRLGDVYRQLGDYDEAERLLIEALELREANLPADDPAIADTLSHLAAVVGQKGDVPRATGLLERAHSIHLRTPIEDPEILVPILGRLSIARSRMGDPDASVALSRQVIAIEEKRFGPNSAPVAHALHNLAVHYSREGELTAARALYERVLAIQEQTLPADDPDLLLTHHNLGELAETLGSLPQAREHLDRVLEAQLRVLGPDHDGTAETLLVLGDVDRAAGNLDAAEDRYRRAAEIFRASLGERHPRLADLEERQARLAAARGDLVTAERLGRSALERRRSSPGGPGVPALATVAHLAEVRLRQGDLDEAEGLLDEAEQAARSFRPNLHVRAGLARLLAVRAALHDARGETAAARAARRRLVEITEGEPWPAAVTEARRRALDRL